MRKPKSIEKQRGLEKLQEEVEALSFAQGSLAKIEAFLRAARRLRKVAIRITGVSSQSEQPEKDLCWVLEWRVNTTLWSEIWQMERTLAAGTKLAQTQEILRKFPMYVQELRRGHEALVTLKADEEERIRRQREQYAVSKAPGPVDPGRRGPRIDLSIELVTAESEDGQFRSLSLVTANLSSSEAQRLADTIRELPHVQAVRVSRIKQGKRPAVRYSIHASLTTNDLARVLEHGLCGMVFQVTRCDAKRVDAYQWPRLF